MADRSFRWRWLGSRVMWDSGELVVGGGPQQGALRLGWEEGDEYVTTLVATVSDVGLSARVRVATSAGAGGLAEFLGELAEGFRGWEGARTWGSWGRELTASAVFRSGGHVAITWAVMGRGAGGEVWRAEVTTVVEAGAEMSALVVEVEALVGGGGSQR
ncbi:DUF6228 family protein [Yinghuangia seranimata]|uniref:DUF6228 family protein n=1 Tax=Yinghuangia seranimata TaxID=408067 RepID=UPI003CCF8D85